jgi:hypothetical protein
MRLRTTIVVLCALLLAQWSLAAHACPALRLAPPGPTSEHAGQLPSANPHADVGTDCVDHDGRTSTIGYKHCNADEQLFGGLGIVFAAPPPLLRIARAPEVASPAMPPASLELARATAPPLKILYCVSLT